MYLYLLYIFGRTTSIVGRLKIVVMLFSDTAYIICHCTGVFRVLSDKLDEKRQAISRQSRECLRRSRENLENLKDYYRASQTGYVSATLLFPEKVLHLTILSRLLMLSYLVVFF